MPAFLHGGDVDEHVLAAAFGLDEAVALLGVEPLDRTHRHGNLRIASITSAVARHRAADRLSVGGMQVRLIKERSKAVRTQRSDDNRLKELGPGLARGPGRPLVAAHTGSAARGFPLPGWSNLFPSAHGAGGSDGSRRRVGRKRRQLRLRDRRRGQRRLRAGQPAFGRSVGFGAAAGSRRQRQLHLDPDSDRLSLYPEQSAHRLVLQDRERNRA